MPRVRAVLAMKPTPVFQFTEGVTHLEKDAPATWSKGAAGVTLCGITFVPRGDFWSRDRRKCTGPMTGCKRCLVAAIDLANGVGSTSPRKDGSI
jgi:hypothetical protein